MVELVQIPIALEKFPPLVSITNRVFCQVKIYFVLEFDRPYGLTHSDKETGFLPNLSVTTKYFPKKPGFWAPMRSPFSENHSRYP
ncbi:hypothetical protein [Microcoleus sp.]|uniref:hypothetical protein n=1 Tax=Microcoleus sp. TaxID=44472 RepID=UPI0035945E4F